MIFELKKPRYEWRTLPSERCSDLFLSREVESWLLTYGVEYDTFIEHEDRDLGGGDGTRTYLIFYIEIEDERAAMMFKLTWM